MADVIEDVEHLLERAIQYLTQVLNVLIQRVHHNKHRPVTRKNLVRWLAAFFPAPKDPKVYLVRSLGDAPSNSTLQRWASCGSLGSAFSAASLQNLVEEDLGDNMVRFRVGASHEEGDSSTNIFQFDDSHFRPIAERFTSTPNIEQCESSSVRSFEQGDKITEMEAELANLRKQIAMLVMAQESSILADQGKADLEEEESNTLSTSSVAAGLPLPCSPALCSTLNDSGCESSEGVPLTQQSKQIVPSPRSESVPGSMPPVPPPPPPPPPPVIVTSADSKWGSVADLIRKRRAGSSSSSQQRQSRQDSVPDMADVLKGLGTVKLRAVDRSPGGTPMNRRKLDDRTPTDPAAIIARALKKKFAKHRGLSPDSDQENDYSSSFMSDGGASPFGQHMLKKTKRRLSLYDSDDWTPVSSPLKTLNA